MIILGIPKDLNNYYMADSETAFLLTQKGMIPKYKDDDVLYFYINKKLLKVLSKLGIE